MSVSAESRERASRELYGWLHLLAAIGAGRSIAGLGASTSSVLAIRARKLVEDYLDPGTGYAWTDPLAELPRIESSVLELVDAVAIGVLRALVQTLIHDDDRSFAWSVLLGSQSNPSGPVLEATADAAVREFRLRSRPISAGSERDPVAVRWTDWLENELPDLDVDDVAARLSRNSAYRDMRSQLARTLTAPDRVRLASWLRQRARDWHVPERVVEDMIADVGGG